MADYHLEGPKAARMYEVILPKKLGYFGKVLEVTEVAVADQVAATANLAMGEATEGTPVAVVRGLTTPRNERPASVLIRPREWDMFR